MDVTFISIFVLIAAAIIYFLPKHGIKQRQIQNKLNKERILIEDSLKHIYDCEYNSLMCTVNSVAGSLNMSSGKSSVLIDKLKQMQLISFEGHNIKLSSDGRVYALRIIRVHRLWEQYLADQTSFGEKEWHKHAEKIEHKLTDDDVKKIARKIGNPIVDPHGDPIPDEDGSLPAKKDFELGLLNVGDKAQIVHIEDEPDAVYSQIIAMGLHRGTQIRIIDKSPNRIDFEANGEECVLSSIIAKNLSVTRIENDDFIFENSFPLSELPKGKIGVIVGISKACRGLQRRRMLDFGIVPGTEITTQLKSSFGDPTAYRVKGTLLALRKSQSNQIYVKQKAI